MAGMGVHWTDLAQGALDRDHTGPVHYTPEATFDPQNVFDVPVTSKATATYADGVELVLDSSGPFPDRFIRFEGDEGYIQVNDHDLAVFAEPKSILNLRRTTAKTWNDMSGHVGNFLECIKNRQQKTTCDPESSHRATTISHIGNIAVRLGRDLQWDPVTEQFQNDEEANRMLSRAMRYPWHL